MLLRFTLSAAGAMVLVSTASAQSRAQMTPITTQVHNAGTYHLATGTWTHGANQTAQAGPETLYDNTCTTGYFTGLADGDIGLDSGRIPSTSSPVNPNSLTGTHDLYEVNGFQIAYCSFEPLITSLAISFTDSYAACDLSPALPTPMVSFNLLNVPGGTSAGGIACWLVTMDLANTTFTFNLGGDANGTYNNVSSTDSFGWTWTQTIPTTGSNAGPFLAGDPTGFFNATGCAVGGGTTFPGASPLLGSGIGILDQFQIANGPTNPGCYWFGGYGGSGGNPIGAFYLQLQGDAGNTGCNGPGNAFCFGDGSGTSCPCSAFGNTGEGCANTSGLGGATLAGSGCAEISNDTLALDVVGVDGQKPGIMLRGNNQIAAVLGNGILCAGGQSGRSSVHVTDTAGATTFTTWDGVNPIGSVANVGAPTNFSFWYRDGAGGCNGAPLNFNFSNGWTVTYIP